MPAVGERENPLAASKGYRKDSMYKLAEQFLDIAKSAISESGVSLYEQPSMFFQKNATNDEMRKLFIKEAYDPKDPRYQDAEDIAQLEADLGELYLNDRKAISENAPLGAFNPVIGITFPMHKNLLMNAVFDQSMPKDITKSPKFTLTMETRTLVTPDGEEIDMFLEQYKIKDAIKNSVPTKDIIITLPENESLDILKDEFGISNANLSIKTCINAVLIDSYVAVGEKYYNTTTKTIDTVEAGGAGVKPVLFNVGDLKFVPSYGEFDRSIMASFTVVAKTDATNTKIVKGIISGYVKKNKFMITCMNTADVKAVRLNAVVDVSSAAFPTCRTKWSARTDIFEVPEAPHMTTTVSPEEVKDVTALYNVNQITKIMSQMRLGLMHYKDDTIHDELDKSFLKLPSTQKISGAFDFIPPQGSYMGSHVSWRQETFMDYLDTQVTYMLNVLNDENMSVTVFGRPELIKKITPRDYSYSSPSNIGPIELDYKKTIVTGEKRVYQFISSQKMRNNNNLIVILTPRNSQRVMYKIVDYQLYISNEIRDTTNYQLPGITCFERWMFLEYQPVQGRIQIMNPTGLREDINNADPIGVSAANDYTANGVTYASAINGAIKP
jgi:hypothetical protein